MILLWIANRVCTLRIVGNAGGLSELCSSLHTFWLKKNFLLLANCCQVRLQRFIIL